MVLVSTVDDTTLVRGLNLFNKVELSIFILKFELRLRVVWLLGHQDGVLNHLGLMSLAVCEAISRHLMHIYFEIVERIVKVE